MLADFYIPKVSIDMKTLVQKNHLRGQIVYPVAYKWNISGFSATFWQNYKK